VSVEPDLTAVDPRSRPVGPKDKSAAAKDMVHLAARLEGLQDALYAEATVDGTRSVLLVLQGMDTSGKGGVIRHVAGLVNPQGLHIASFKKPTEQERAQHFLQRIRKETPKAGQIGVFDRSHYEDVLAARVRGVVDRRTWGRRYRTINTFEAKLVASGTRVVKCFLHISAEEQRARLLARLDDPTKHWKYNPGDLEDRALWADYMAAYADALERCSTDVAPWHIVPADRKWYRNWAITQLLIEALEALDLGWPEADFDVDEERRRLLAIP
jgi:PPK2 family polyphosphate:nucleotide phosphotransferase